VKIINLQQGTPEWLAWRQAGIGSSDIPIILGVSPWTKPEKLLREKVTGVPARKSNGAMRRGHDLEPVARALYEAIMGIPVLPVCGEDDVREWMKVSLDGWDSKNRITIEIKCPNKDDHKLALDGKIPVKYQPQCDWQIGISGSLLHHYVSYNPTSFAKSEEFAVVLYPRNEGEISRINSEAEKFWCRVVEEREKLAKSK